MSPRQRFLGKTWAPRGKTPKAQVTVDCPGRPLSGNEQCGHLLFALYEKRIASDEVIHFLAQMLCHHRDRHLVVPMDNVPPHVSKKTNDVHRGPATPPCVFNFPDILIHGSVALTKNSNDSLRQVLTDWVSGGDTAANVANIRSRLHVTDNSSHANRLWAGSGLDWFWAMQTPRTRLTGKRPTCSTDGPSRAVGPASRSPPAGRDFNRVTDAEPPALLTPAYCQVPSGTGESSPRDFEGVTDSEPPALPSLAYCQSAPGRRDLRVGPTVGPVWQSRRARTA